MSTYFTRQKKDRDYTVVDNVYLKDDALSWEARGLMTYLLSLPDDWEINLVDLQKRAKNGRDALRSIVRELETHGYLRREQVRGKGGTFARTNFHVIERPDEESPSTGNPSTGKPTTVEPRTDNPTLLSTNKNKVLTKQSTNNTHVDKSVDEEAVRLAQLLEDRVRANHPYLKEDPRAVERWSEDIDKLHRIDGRDWQLIEAVLKWSQQNDFWQNNIKSGKKLRLQFDELLVRINAERKKTASRVGVV